MGAHFTRLASPSLAFALWLAFVLGCASTGRNVTTSNVSTLANVPAANRNSAGKARRQPNANGGAAGSSNEVPPPTPTPTASNRNANAPARAPQNRNSSAASVPEEADHAGATARCGDGSLSYSAHRRGTCSHHGGVAEWY
jgi:hypothetical protein